MDCTICSSFPTIIRPPRNTICGACLEGIKHALALISNTEVDSRLLGDRKLSNQLVAPNKGLGDLAEWIKCMKSVECELNERICFLAGSLRAFTDQIHTDIRVKPGDGPPVSAHRGILASRSEIFQNMLDSDTCKAPLDHDSTIPIPELTHEELKSLLEFLYSGDLPPEKVEKQAYSLSLIAHKFEIPYLEKFCERYMLRSLGMSTALDVLEISDACSNQKMKERVLGFIVRNFEEIAFSDKYEEFCRKNPHLSVRITRATLSEARSSKRPTSGEACSPQVAVRDYGDGFRIGDNLA